MVYRTLPEPWVPFQLAEKNLRDEVDHLRAAAEGASNAAGLMQAATELEVCADRMRCRWLPHERELPDEDRLLAEAILAFLSGDETGLDGELPEQGVRVCGPGLAVFMRFADSTSSEEPELLLVDDLLG